MEHLFDNGVNARKVTQFVVPSVIMFVFIALYYLIDAIFVANFISSDALAAINIVYPITGLGWGISVMLASGASSIVAIKLGEGDEREASEKFSQMCIVSVVLGIAAAVLGLVYLDNLLEHLGATELLWQYCRDYAWIIILSLPSAFLGILLEYFIRVDGRPGFTLFLYVSGGLVHIILDFVFIVVLDWGIKGAAWLCAAGQLTVLLLGIGYFATQETKLRFLKPRWDWGYLQRSIINGSSEMVSESSAAVTIYVFNIIVIGLAGENGLAALSIVFNVHYLLISVHLGFITGIAPLISYYFGARDYDKVNYFLRYSRVFIVVSSAAVALLAAIEAPLLARIFVSGDSEVYAIAVRGIRLLSVAFLFTGVNVYASGFFTAYANGIISAAISMSRGLIMVLIGAAILPRFLGLDGIWITTVFAEVTTLFLTIFMFNKYKNVYHYNFNVRGKLKQRLQ